MKITLSIFLLTILTLFGAGCGEGVKFKGTDVETSRPGQNKAWPYLPVSMRIHPFTSIERDDETSQIILDAQVELLDCVGDVTKGIGQFRFELYAIDQRASSVEDSSQLLYSWDVPMQTLLQNRQHYDSITRTYAFKLKMDHQPEADTSLKLVVQFDNAYGKRMSAKAILNINHMNE